MWFLELSFSSFSPPDFLFRGHDELFFRPPPASHPLPPTPAEAPYLPDIAQLSVDVDRR